MKKVLVIEATDVVRNVVVGILEFGGYSVCSASNGKAGFAMALIELPDLIVCDVLIPVFDGFGVLKLVHHDPKLRFTPFVFLLDKLDRTGLRKIMNLGADDFLMKPVNATELLQAVSAQLEKREELCKNFNPAEQNSDAHKQGLSDLELFDLTSVDRMVKYFKGKQTVYSKGENARELYFIKKGNVKQVITNEDGKEVTTVLLEEGDFFGLESALDEKVYDNSSIALTDVELIVIPSIEVTKMMQSDSMVSKKFIAILHKRLSEVETRLLNLAYDSARKRVANGLLSFSTVLAKGADNTYFDVHRSELANITGLAKESVVRVLSDFKSEGLIDIADQKILVKREDKMKAMFN